MMSVRRFSLRVLVLSLTAACAACLVFQNLVLENQVIAQTTGSNTSPGGSGGASSGGASGNSDKEDCSIGNGNIVTVSPTTINPQNDYTITNNQLKRPTTICPAETRFVRP
ncbi:MAG: hypothetical protein K2X01_04735 [Cyanobacteria bacterium]|nr:hypothetical protein [Cyanobacteriota bacterium]